MSRTDRSPSVERWVPPMGTPGTTGRLGESLIATWAVAGGLIALVYSIGPIRDAVRSAPWLMGPGLWVMTALGAGTILGRLPGRDYSGRTLAVATFAGGAADGLVVSTGHPWPGLVTGAGVFSVVMALLGGPGGGRRHHGTPRSAAGPQGRRG
jgi:hypothetical protein